MNFFDRKEGYSHTSQFKNAVHLLKDILLNEFDI